jgi:predicted RNase H-like nuclease (RuvC/YqgF family)
LINYGLDEILLLKPKRYNHHTSEFKNDQLIIYKNDYKNEIGLVAQDVYAIIPEAVTVPEDENTDLWSMDYDKLVPVLIKGMQEQQEQIESQQSQIDELSEMISEMKTEIASLRSQ